MRVKNWKKNDDSENEEMIRIRFGNIVSVGLGLLIAAEILLTIEQFDLGRLFAVALTVVVRMLVGVLVRSEEQRLEQRRRPRQSPWRLQL